MGRVTGMMFTVMSPVQFLIDPALRLTFTVFHNDFRPLTLILLASLIPIVCLTFVLQRVSKEESVKVPSTEERQGQIKICVCVCVILLWSVLSMPLVSCHVRYLPAC